MGFQRADLARIGRGHDRDAQAREFADDWRDRLDQRGRHHDRLGAAVLQYEGVLLGGEQGVERDRHDAGADRAPERDRIIDRIEQQQRDTRLLLEAERVKPAREAAGVGLQRAIVERALGIDERDLVGEAAVNLVVDQLGRRVIRPPHGEILGHAAPSRFFCLFFIRKPLGSPPPASEASGGEGSGVGGTLNKQDPPPPTPPRPSLRRWGGGAREACARFASCRNDGIERMHYNTSREVSMAKGRKSAKGEIDAFLKRLGERVRTMRSRRGMSRKVLARHSKVSERYLAQLEAGAGNCSIVLLRRIAHAMSVPVAELIDERPDRPVENLLLAQLIDRLAPAELARARELLLAQFGGPSSATRNGRIALIGLRGGGKSTLGRRLAADLKVQFIELDREIERNSGMALAEMFEMFGQETFRRLERGALEAALAENERFVLATGGSLVTEPGTFELLLASCLTVWVRAKPTEHMARVIAQGDLRPMADNARAMDDLNAILASREPLYAKADFALDTAGKSAAQSARELMKLLSHNAQSLGSPPPIRAANGGEGRE